MTQRREDQFMFLISSSDRYKDVFINNSASDFTINLKDPIEFAADEDWEVGIIDLYYPFSWYNVGPSVTTKMKYKTKDGVSILEFPNWQCETIEEVVAYMKAELAKVTDLYTVSVDALGRFKLESTGSACNVGFTKNLRVLLGLSEHDETFWYEEMNVRAYHYIKIQEFWINKDPLTDNSAIFDEVFEINDPVLLARTLKPYINVKKLTTSVVYAEDAELESKAIDANISAIANVLEVSSPSALFKKNFKILERHLSMLCASDMILPAKIIMGVKPPRLIPFEQFFIRSNLIQPLDINNELIDVMKIITCRGERNNITHETFIQPTYQPVKKGGKITSIHMYITSESGDFIPFQGGTVLMTLHFRKQQYRR